MIAFSVNEGDLRHTDLPDTGKKASHIKELDGLRGIAVLSILILHFYDLTGPVSKPYGSLVDRFMPVLAGGVDLFFVLSGFLITRILVTTRHATNYFRVFYMRRVLRIFPLYFLIVLGFFFLALPVAHRHGFDMKLTTRQLGWYLLFAQNWMQAFRINDGAQLAHLWTLAIEEQFYLVWPAAVLLCSSKALRYFAVAFCVVALAFRVGSLLHPLDSNFVYFGTLTRLDTLLLGSVLALSPKAADLFGSYAPVLIPAGLFMAVVSPAVFVPEMLLVVCGSSVALAALRTGSLLRSNALGAVGKYSFGIYVFHYLIHGALAPLAPKFNPVLFTSAAIVLGSMLSFVLAVMSWRLLEQPFLRLKKRFPYTTLSSA